MFHLKLSVALTRGHRRVDDLITGLQRLCSQSCGIAVADNVPVVVGFAPYDLMGRSLQEVVARLLDG